MKHKIKMAAAILPLLLGSSIANAETDLFGGKVKAGGYLAQHWQSPLEVKGNLNSAADAQADSGFQRLRAGLWFDIDIADRVSVFMELAEEPHDYGATFSINQDLAWIELEVQKGMALRVGNVVESTMNFLRYSDGAAVQGNPLIGNGVNDMIAAAHGLWLTGGSDTSFGKWDYNLTLSKPSFFDDFSEESGYNYGARTSITTAGGFGFGAGVMIMDGDVLGCPTTTTCVLGKGSSPRSLFTRGDGDHYSVGQQGVTSKNTAGILPGIDATIWQIDAMWSGDALGKPVTIHGFYGEGEDEYSHTGGSFVANTAGTYTTTDAEQSFWGVFGRVDLTNSIYLASRYGVSENETSGVGGQNELDRLQVGVGYWFADSSLLKVEYVRQEGEAQSAAASCSFAGTGDCEWEGVVAELSVSF